MRLVILAGGQEYAPEALPPDILVEQGCYRIRLEEERTGADPDQYEAAVGEMRLPLVRSRVGVDRVLLEWEWQPDFFAGEFALVVRHGTDRIYPAAGEVHLPVVTDALKLTAADYEAMLTDLSDWISGWLTAAPGRRRGEGVEAPSDSDLARLEFLIRHWQNIVGLVEGVVAHPRRTLERMTAATPLHNLRTVTDDDWQGLLSHPAEWQQYPSAPASLRALHQRTGGRLPVAITQSFTRSTLAVPENLFVVRFLTEVRQELSQVLARVNSLLAPHSSSPRELLLLRQEQARKMLRTATGWLRSTWLAELAPGVGATQPSVVALKHPVYGLLWRIYTHWKRAVALTDKGDRSLPLDRTHQLYEYWCFLTVVRAVAAVLGADPAEEIQRALEPTALGLRLNLEPGRSFPVHFPHRGVSVTFQRTFAHTGLQSISFAMRPDITIEWTGEEGAPRLLLLDPKYRVGHDGLRQGLGDMHRYRDALVSADGNRIVAGGYLLTPAPPKAAGDQRYLGEEYQQRWDFGMCLLRPGEGCERLEALLRRHLPVPSEG